MGIFSKKTTTHLASVVNGFHPSFHINWPVGANIAQQIVDDSFIKEVKEIKDKVENEWINRFPATMKMRAYIQSKNLDIHKDYEFILNDEEYDDLLKEYLNINYTNSTYNIHSNSFINCYVDRFNIKFTRKNEYDLSLVVIDLTDKLNF